MCLNLFGYRAAVERGGGVPVLWTRRYAPEFRHRAYEFDSDLRFAHEPLAYISHSTEELFTCFEIHNRDELVLCDVRRQKDKSSMRVHDEGVCFLGDGLRVPSLHADYDANPRPDAPTAPSLAFVLVLIVRRLSHVAPLR